MRMDEQTNPEWKRQCQGSKSGRKALAEIERLTAELASKHEWCVNTDLANAELQAKVEELECSLTISRKKHDLSIAKVYELERLLDSAEQELPHDVACPDECLKCACAKAATELEGE